MYAHVGMKKAHMHWNAYMYENVYMLISSSSMYT